MNKALICAFASLLLLAPTPLAAEEPTRPRLRLEIGERYRFALTEEHEITLGGVRLPGDVTDTVYTLEVVGKSPEGDYDVAMSYRVVSDRQDWKKILADDPNLLPYARLEEEGWRMTVTGGGIIREVVGPSRMFDDLRATVARNPRLEPMLQHMESGIGNDGLGIMMQDDMALSLPDEIVSGGAWERRAVLRSPWFEEVRSISRERFVGMDRRQGRPCANLLAEGEVELVEPGDRLGGIVRGNLEIAARVDNPWRPVASRERMERCIDVETGLPVEALTIRFFGLEVLAEPSHGSEEPKVVARMTVEERDRLRQLDAGPTDDGVWIYWGRSGEIGRMRLDGSMPEILLRGSGFPMDVVVDEAAGKVYWTDSVQGAVFRVDLDGSRVEEIYQGTGGPGALAIAAGTLYWTDPRARVVWRMEAGAAPSRITSFDYFNPADLAVQGDHIYWTTAHSKRLYRAGRGGGEVEDEFLWLTDEAAPLALDEKRICWLDDENPSVWCAPRGGGEPRRVVEESAKGLTALTLQGGNLYWIASPEVWQGPSTFRRVRADGGPVTDLLTTPGWVRGLAVTGDALYWTEDKELRKLVLAEGRPRTLVSGAVGDVQRLATWAGKLYWIENQRGVGTLRRSELDGSGVEDLVTEIRSATGLAIADGKLLWSENSNNDCVIRRAELDGSGVETIRCGSGRPDRLIAERGGLYWADVVLDTIVRADVDGSGQGPVLTPRSKFNELVKKTVTGEIETSASPASVAVHDGYLYWSDSSLEKIVRADLDGGGQEDLITGLEYPGDLAISADGIYWVDISPYRIRRADLDGSGAHDVVSVEKGTIAEIALADGAIFWSGSDDDLEPYISRARLDGTGKEVLLAGDDITGPGFQLTERQKELIIAFPDDLAVAGGKIYWPEHASHRILRADVDGTNVEVLIEGVSRPEGLTIADGWLYWLEDADDSIRRARLDGSEAGKITGIEGAATSLAVAGGRLYWTELTEDRVMSSAMDGSDVRALFAGPSFPPPGYTGEDLMPRSISGLARLADSILWTDQTGGTLQRVKLGQSNVETLAEKLILPKALRIWDADLYWVDAFGIQRARVAAPTAARLLTKRKNIEDILIVVESIP